MLRACVLLLDTPKNTDSIHELGAIMGPGRGRVGLVVLVESSSLLWESQWQRMDWYQDHEMFDSRAYPRWKEGVYDITLLLVFSHRFMSDTSGDFLSVRYSDYWWVMLLVQSMAVFSYVGAVYTMVRV